VVIVAALCAHLDLADPRELLPFAVRHVAPPPLATTPSLAAEASPQAAGASEALC
jgi:hypothetical protein